MKRSSIPVDPVAQLRALSCDAKKKKTVTFKSGTFRYVRRTEDNV